MRGLDVIEDVMGLGDFLERLRLANLAELASPIKRTLGEPWGVPSWPFCSVVNMLVIA